MLSVMRQVAIKPCPFCGAELKPMTALSFDDKVMVHYFHPGVSTDDDCVLSGKGYSVDALTKWNMRVASGMEARRAASEAAVHDSPTGEAGDTEKGNNPNG